MDKIDMNSKEGEQAQKMGFWRFVGRSMERLTWIAAIGAIVVLAVVILFIAKEITVCFDQPQSQCIWSLARWNPVSEPARYGIAFLLINSVLLAACATVVALPLGLITALYITEIASAKMAQVFWLLMRVVGAVPPVVVGFLGIVTVTGRNRTLLLSDGEQLFLCSVLLAFMAIPRIVCFLIETLRSIPASFKASSYALGASHWQTIVHTICPAARPGIAAAGLFSFGRVLGDTVIALMLIQILPLNRFAANSPLWTVPTAVALGAESAVPGQTHYHLLYLLGLLLAVASFSLSLLGRQLIRTQRGELE